MSKGKKDRRDFVRGALALMIGGIVVAASRRKSSELVWQLDPEKCTQCGRCATHCVLSPSAVKCFHSYSICGYCDLCGGYLRPDAKQRNTGAENLSICLMAAASSNRRLATIVPMPCASHVSIVIGSSYT